MESNAHLLLGVHLENPATDPLVFRFQQSLHAAESLEVRVPKSKAEALGKGGLIDALATHYVQQHPAEEERIGREMVRRVIRAAMDRWD